MIHPYQAPAVERAIEALMAADHVCDHGPNKVHAWITRASGQIEDLGIVENLRTTVGGDWQADVMGNSTQPVSARWIALTADTGAAAAGDTTLTAEITTNGGARAVGTYAHTGGTASYTITKTFTASGALTAIHKAGLFTAISTGTMAFETVLSSDATLATNDTLTITWTVNI